MTIGVVFNIWVGVWREGGGLRPLFLDRFGRPYHVFLHFQSLIRLCEQSGTHLLRSQWRCQWHVQFVFHWTNGNIEIKLRPSEPSRFDQVILGYLHRTFRWSTQFLVQVRKKAFLFRTIIWSGNLFNLLLLHLSWWRGDQ